MATAVLPKLRVRAAGWPESHSDDSSWGAGNGDLVLGDVGVAVCRGSEEARAYSTLSPTVGAPPRCVPFQLQLTNMTAVVLVELAIVQ